MVVRRLVVIGPVTLLISGVLFAMASVSPFDPLIGYLGSQYVLTSDADKLLLRDQLGLDRGWGASFLQWLGGIVTGDLGTSRSFSAPVGEVIAERLPWTLLLAGTGFAIAVALALGVGVLAGRRPGGLCDRVVVAVCVIAQGSPPFVLAMGAVGVFALALRWFPVAGVSDRGAAPDLFQVLHHLVLPAGVVAVSQLPWLLLAVRESVAVAQGQDFVAGARSRGVPPRTVLLRHVLPVSLGPFVNVVGARLPEVVVGAALVEEIFSWPGVAGALVTAARNLDMGLLATLTAGTAVVVMLGSLAADVVVALLDPRVATDG